MVANRRLLSLALIMAAFMSTGCRDEITEAEPSELGPLRFTVVTTGLDHSCALAHTATVYCWGGNQNSQLGDRGRTDSAKPVRAASPARFVDVSAGAYHTCAVEVSGELHCWGNNNWGQLGNGSTVTLVEPIVIPTEARFTQVSSGWLHSCALSGSGQAYCWGAGGQGQLGTGRLQSEFRPTQVEGTVRFARISAGGYHTCGISLDQRVYCWGQNSLGQLGLNTVLNSTSPARVEAPSAIDLDAGESHTCMASTGGVAYCWGSSVYGELGTSYVTGAGVPASLQPSRLTLISGVKDITAGAGFSCAVTVLGLSYCWGRGFEGQLGNGQTRNWPTPQTVSHGEKSNPVPFSIIDASAGTHACGLTAQSTVYCWGRGDRGQLGNNVTTFSSSAMRISTQ